MIQELRVPDTDELTPVLQIRIWKHSVNIYTDKSELVPYINRIRSRQSTYRIPAFSVSDEHHFDSSSFGMFVTFSKHAIAEWIPEKNLSILGIRPENSEMIDKEVAYKTLSLTERMRQLEGQLLSNGAAVVNPDNKGVLILGKRAHGKSSVCLLMCKKYGYSLKATDQVIFGFNKNLYSQENNIWVFEGTRYLTMRRSIADRYFPEFLSLFPKGNFWDDKIDIKENDLNVEVSTSPSRIYGAFLVNVDYDEKMPFSNVIEARNDLESSLFVAEVTSRHITGICSPILDENDSFLTFCPSFDDENTRKIRKLIIRRLFEIPLYKISAGNSAVVADYINQTIKYK